MFVKQKKNKRLTGEKGGQQINTLNALRQIWKGTENSARDGSRTQTFTAYCGPVRNIKISLHQIQNRWETPVIKVPICCQTFPVSILNKVCTKKAWTFCFLCPKRKTLLARYSTKISNFPISGDKRHSNSQMQKFRQCL